MQFAGRIETNRFQKYFCKQIVLLIAGFDTPIATIAQGYSTSELIQLLNLPIEARTNWTLADFGPLCAGRAGNIHVE